MAPQPHATIAITCDKVARQRPARKGLSPGPGRAHHPARACWEGCHIEPDAEAYEF
jgi:hypothetical protein